MNFTDFNAMVESNAASLRSSWRNYSLSSSALIAVIVFGGDHLDGKRPMMVFAILNTVGSDLDETPDRVTGGFDIRAETNIDLPVTDIGTGSLS